MDLAPQSIDAIVQISAQDLQNSALPSLSSPYASPLASPVEETPRKHRNRKRLFLGLQRISSSPSLAKMRPSSYRSGTGASMSCVSLSSASSWGLNSANSLHSDVSQMFSTAPTSVAGSPGPSSPHWDMRPRARTLSFKDLPSSVALPSSVRPASPISVDDFAIAEVEYYFSCQPLSTTADASKPARPDINFWEDLPSELRLQIFSFLTPKEVIQCSTVSKTWHEYCFDGQLWQSLDVSPYYRDIPADALVKIISRAGPFVRDINLRGCVQLRDKWSLNGFVESCQNIENLSLEGCLIDRAALHTFLLLNPRLVHINVSGLAVVTNAALKIIGQQCPELQVLNLTWCQNVDTRGLRRVIQGCPSLRDLRVGEIRGWDDHSFALELFRRNTLERLVLTNCGSLSDQSLAALIVGQDPDGEEAEIDWLTGRYLCPPRTLKHLNLTRCKNITDAGLKVLAHNMPYLEGLQISKCVGLTEASLINVLPTFPALTHLDLEELNAVSNEALSALAASPAATTLRHLSISYCEAVTDAGMVPFIRACKNLAQLDLDNTRVSDLCLIEAAALVRERNRRAALDRSIHRLGTRIIKTGLKMVVYDCPNITWIGVRAVLSSNAALFSEPVPPPVSNIVIPPTSFSPSTFVSTTGSSTNAVHVVRHPQNVTSASPISVSASSPTYPHEVVALKAFYTWQPTINEHAKRVNAFEFHRARRLEHKWAEYMICGEEVSQNGSDIGGRRRRRRMREAMEAMAGEENDEFAMEDSAGGAAAGLGFAGLSTAIGRRRRARSAPMSGPGSGCTIM